ncbi:MAG: FliI/YscN family ATPase [Candidatus Hydrogenedentes bacterium]|nr:FliI/YscN family ATPase [Candidatus Hydrogenedentota bacterium]
MPPVDLAQYRERLRQQPVVKPYGRVVDVVGLTVQATGPRLQIGELCFVISSVTGERLAVEVVGFRENRILLMPLGDMRGIGPGSVLIPTGHPQRIPVGAHLLGRVIGSLGQPLDDGPPISATETMPLTAKAPHPLRRQPIAEPIATGIRAIDGCTTCGKGQRIGIMAGSGVGKSKLIGMIARNTNADVNVIALIGERGREVRDFIDKDLGPEGLARSVVVVATSDEPALLRLNGAYVATAVAEWFREQGADVMLMMDSVTRFAMAQREIGLAVGEPPTTKGYPPSVYAILPRLLERAGTAEVGSITGFYAVLVEADDLNDPVGDAARSILDGHIALSRGLASRNHYPAIDVLESISRTMVDVTPEAHRRHAARIRQIMATYRDAEDLINIGAYVAGSNPEIDESIRLMPRIRRFLQQDLYERAAYHEIESQMRAALGEA